MDTRLETKNTTKLTYHERSYILQDQINKMVKEGWVVEYETQASAILVKRVMRVHPAITWTIAILTAGIAWLLLLAWRKTKRAYLYVDDEGGVRRIDA